MEGFFDLLNSYLANEVILRRILVGLTATTIFILGIGLSVLIMNLTSPLRRRLGYTKEEPPAKDRMMVRVSTVLGPVASYVLPQKESERDNMTDQLIRAGFRSPQALSVFYAVKTLLIVALPMAVLIGSRWFPELETRFALPTP